MRSLASSFALRKDGGNDRLNLHDSKRPPAKRGCIDPISLIWSRRMVLGNPDRHWGCPPENGGGKGLGTSARGGMATITPLSVLRKVECTYSEVQRSNENISTFTISGT